MSQDEFNPQANVHLNDEQQNLSENELDEITGGMQNQLNNNPVANNSNGGLFKSAKINPGKVSFRCNGAINEGQ